MIAVLASGVAFALSLAPAQGATRKIEIHAVYNAPKCPSGTALTPILRAKLTVTIGSQTIRRVLDERGTAELEVSSTAKEARAKVALDGNVLEIDPYGASTPYSFTEELRLAGHNTFTVEPQQLEDRGASSAWSILSLGTELGRTSMPAGVSLPKVTARYDPGRGPTGGLPDVPGHNTAYDSGTREILIDSISFADEFEPWVLLHEYGHLLLGTVADSGPDSGGAHDIDQSYPGKPAVAWSEGFAHGFAAIARKNPVLGTQCRTAVNLSTHPATPRSADGPNLNQYHEASIGGVVWGLASRLGGGNVQAGLEPLLGAIHKFHVKYGGPESASEARDALTEFGDRQDTALQQAIGNVFDDQRLRWGFSMREISQVIHGQGGGWVFPWARGGACNMSYPDGYPITSPDDEFFAGPEEFDRGAYNRGATPVVDGPLDYTRHDECWETVRGHYLDDNARYSLIQTMPYLDGQAHRRQDTTLGVVFACVDVQNSCASSRRTVTISVGTGVWHRPDGATHLDDLKPLDPATVTVTVPPTVRQTLLPRDITAVAKVDAQGHCTVLVGARQDCGR